MSKIKKLLVANRGEIAVRVFRTCQELGIATVAVYSDADADSIHTKMADERVHLGASDSASSYLSIPKILVAASETGADAIHPGYGFLSERAEFSQACEKVGVVFVGPSPESMTKLGDKISAKHLAQTAQVPVVPGYFKPGACLHDLAEAAERVGYPVMLKAAAGGGGRGMRLVNHPSELEAAFELAAQEAQNAFGDREMMLEKLILNPRHIEVQVLADTFGNVACLFERECSLQRRNQKMIEEAPSPAVQSGLVNWPRLKESAERLVRAAGYTNAGTVEFIADSRTGEFYFLEVNARLQVEHPVTEAITGLDLVALQIQLAQGEPLNLPKSLLDGDRNLICGHAIEARILAEDPSKGYMPSVGPILKWLEPKRMGVRVDAGFEQGSEVSSHYDSLIAKVISHGANRDAALNKLKLALEDFHVLGIATNIQFLLDVLEDPAVVRGDLETGLLGKFMEDWSDGPVPDEIGAISKLIGDAQGPPSIHNQRAKDSAWGLQDGFRNVRV